MINPQFGTSGREFLANESEFDEFLAKNLSVFQMNLFTDCIPSLVESLFSKGINAKSEVSFTYNFESSRLVYNEEKLSNLGVKFTKGKFNHDFDEGSALMEWRYLKISEVSCYRTSVFIVMSMFPEISIQETVKLVNNARGWIGDTEGMLYLTGTLKDSNEPFMKIVAGF